MPNAQLATAAQRSAASVREQLQQGRRELRERYGADGNARRMLRQHRLLIDRTLRSLWTQAALPGSLALAAVGGYGRGELFPIPTSICWCCCRTNRTLSSKPSWRH